MRVWLRSEGVAKRGLDDANVRARVATNCAKPPLIFENERDVERFNTAGCSIVVTTAVAWVEL